MDQTASDKAQVPIIEWRGKFTSPEVELLHSRGFDRAVTDYDWWGQVQEHSLGWVCARIAGELVGWVNLVWDGATHAFVLDTVVDPMHRRRGVGVELVRACVENARTAGCEWVHVDFDEPLSDFYFKGCGFVPTPAGVISLLP